MRQVTLTSASTILAICLLFGIVTGCEQKDVEVGSVAVGQKSENVTLWARGVWTGSTSISSDINTLSWPECRRIKDILVQRSSTLSPPVSVTIYYNDNDCADSQSHAKAECQWSSHPEFWLKENWLCLSPDGHVDGTVRKSDAASEWSAFKGGSYCDNGGGFITRQAAMACIQKEGITK